MSTIDGLLHGKRSAIITITITDTTIPTMIVNTTTTYNIFAKAKTTTTSA
jgi:hypothetical protein